MKTWMTGIVAAGCVAVINPVGAQVQSQETQPRETEAAARRKRILDEITEVQESANKLQMRLEAIAQKAQEQNPDLLKLQNDLMDVYRKKLDEYGYPSEEKLQKLRGMQERLQATGIDDMDEAERQQMTQQFNAEVAKLQEAREKAQNDPRFLAAQQTLEEARSKAMSEVDPQAPALLKELEGFQSKLEELRQDLQQVLQAPLQ